MVQKIHPWGVFGSQVFPFSKPLVCVRARARAHVRMRRFLCEGVRRKFQKYSCGCVRAPLVGADVRRTFAHSSFL